MAEKSFPFDANFVGGQWDRTFNSADDRARYGSLVSNGVFADPANNLQVFENTGMKILLKRGKAWINGAFYENDGDRLMQISEADPVLNRIDSVVLTLSLSARKIIVGIKRGAPSARPVRPTLSRTTSEYQIAVADIYVGAGVGKITQSQIVDTRFEKERCGIVHGLIDQIDTTGLFKQYDSKFNTWFDEIKGKLGDDPALTLQSQIDIINNNLASGKGVNADKFGGKTIDKFKVFYEEVYNNAPQRQVIEKYNDGTMIIYQTHVVNIAISSQWGGIYQSVTDGIAPENFRYPFVGVPQVSITPQGSSTGHAFWVTAYNMPTSTNAGKFNICRATPGPQAEWRVNIIARGRWK